jgi:hypothetical protein
VSVITRSIDLFLQRPVPFLLIALPTAVLSVIGSLLYVLGGGPQAFTPGVAPTISPAAALGFVLSLATIVVAIALSLAMTLAADDVRAGRTVDVRARFSQGIRRTGIVILSFIVEGIALVGLVLGGSLIVVLVAVTRSVPLIFIGFVVLMVVVFWVILRWSMSATAIALEPVGPLEALGRSRAVTRGNVWRIVAIYLRLGLLTLPLAFGIGLLSLAISDLTIVVIVLSSFTTLATAPLFGIVSTTIFGDLTGRPEAPRAQADGQLRLAYVGGIVLVGVIALAIAIPRAPAAFERLALQAIPAQSRGIIVASSIRNPFDPCQPIPIRGSLPAGVPIYVGGYFTRPIPAGGSGTVEVYIDGQLVNAEPLGEPGRSIACYYEQEPLTGVSSSTWRIVVRSGGETIAEGQFVVR